MSAFKGLCPMLCCVGLAALAGCSRSATTEAARAEAGEAKAEASRLRGELETLKANFNHLKKSGPTPAAPAPVRSADGALSVKWTKVFLQTATGRETSSDTIEAVTAIDFYPGFIVVQTKDGSGMVFSPDRTLELFWKPAKN